MLKNNMDWAISSEASLETKMNVQRLLKSPKDYQIIINIMKEGSYYGIYGESKP